MVGYIFKVALETGIVIAGFALIPHEHIVNYANFLAEFHTASINLLAPLADMAIENMASAKEAGSQVDD